MEGVLKGVAGDESADHRPRQGSPLDDPLGTGAAAEPEKGSPGHAHPAEAYTPNCTAVRNREDWCKLLTECRARCIPLVSHWRRAVQGTGGSAVEITRDRAVWIYERMALIRVFEERVAQLFADGRAAAFVHLYAGEEAVAVGICTHLNDGDFITSTHRGHGHCIAKGVDPGEMMAELFGRLGGAPPLAAGAALTAKVQRSGAVAVCFFGDGAAEQGTTHEAMNLAAIWKLPVVFVCENKQFA